MNEKLLGTLVSDERVPVYVLAAMLQRLGGRVEFTGAELEQMQESSLLWSYYRSSPSGDQLLVLGFDEGIQ